MKERLKISGFADEIDPDFRRQLDKVTELGMRYISLRSANGKSIAEFTEASARGELLPVLQEYGVGVSSIGSPIGKIDVRDEAAFEVQKAQLSELCRISHALGCRYIRVFSFFIPRGESADDYEDTVIGKMEQFVDIAAAQDIVLIHENEKDIYGDIARRCRTLLDAVGSPYLRAAFDFANFVQCGEDPEDCWNQLEYYIEYIHIKDAVTDGLENVVCGTGEGRIEKLLTRAIDEEGYEGFLTLEPHLVVFGGLSQLEHADEGDTAAAVVWRNKARNGAEGYEMQYRALCEILDKI